MVDVNVWCINTIKQRQMDLIITALLVLSLTKAVTNLKTATFPLGPKTGDVQPSGLCQLPPYTQRGGYVVLDREEAVPGDTFRNVSLVEYTTDENNQVFQIKRLTCSLGQWYQDIFEYHGKELYFYTSWCPYFCSSFSKNEWKECLPLNVDENPKGVPQSGRKVVEKRSESNNTRSGFCRLPPYPSYGTYVVQNWPDAGPGDTFQNVSLIQYTNDELNTVVTIKHLRCSRGVWYQKVFQEASESLQFHSSWCPALCSQCFGGKLADRQYALLLNNGTLTKKEIPIAKTTFCALPPYPEFGNYSLISDNEGAKPGDVLDSLRLNYTCSGGYNLVGNRHVYCLKGVWSNDPPKCSKFCLLIRQPGVEYSCEEADSDEGVEPCGAHAQDGTVVTPRCSSPYYRSRAPLKPMTCVNGEWNNVPVCKPVCGLRLQSEGRSVADARLRAPWHVAIFNKISGIPKNTCGGSIVARNLVISGANCFTRNFEKDDKSVNYYVVAGKLYYFWYQPNDVDAQTSEVADIKVPPSYTGVFSSYQHDIALVFLSTSLVFNDYVWPVCLNFDKDLEKMQLAEGRLGLVASWGQSAKALSDVLRIVELPNIDPHICVIKAMNTKSRYGEERQITSDKICAGNDTGTPLCDEDNGGGFVVPETDPTDPRKSYYYLRGVVSLYNRNLCNEVPFSVFTKVSAHENFIRRNIADAMVMNKGGQRKL